jgi:hypothetical protein
VTTGEERDQRLIDDLALTEDDAADTLADERQADAQSLDVCEELVGVVREGRQGFATGVHEIGSFPMNRSFVR